MQTFKDFFWMLVFWPKDIVWTQKTAFLGFSCFLMEEEAECPLIPAPAPPLEDKLYLLPLDMVTWLSLIGGITAVNWGLRGFTCISSSPLGIWDFPKGWVRVGQGAKPESRKYCLLENAYVLPSLVAWLRGKECLSYRYSLIPSLYVYGCLACTNVCASRVWSAQLEDI